MLLSNDVFLELFLLSSQVLTLSLLNFENNSFLHVDP